MTETTTAPVNSSAPARRAGALSLRCILYATAILLSLFPWSLARADSFYPNSGVDVTVEDDYIIIDGITLKRNPDK